VCSSSPSDPADQTWKTSRSAYYSDDLGSSSVSLPPLQSHSFLLLEAALHGTAPARNVSSPRNLTIIPSVCPSPLCTYPVRDQWRNHTVRYRLCSVGEGADPGHTRAALKQFLRAKQRLLCYTAR